MFKALTTTAAPRHGGAQRLRRRLVGAVVGMMTVVGAGIGLAAPASAMTIVNGDMPWTYLGQYWYDYYGSWYVVDAYSPPVGGGRLVCWAGTLSCWWDQFPWKTY